MKKLQWSTLVAVGFGMVAFLVLRMSFPDIETAKFGEVIGLVAVLGAFVGGWVSSKGAKK
ncbi:hypothetical protein FSB08_17020 [Paraburkholderia sp. JPY432]|uniref:hypothetical protein n=1 Tax=Paraburkholderia youngii TaxID=2782701 RepID=UPI0015955F6A|nr:hypothetical protein [Paraburkholderia youngii]NVH74206.1 hypothetical protein [Paraburkholderia youngii]